VLSPPLALARRLPEARDNQAKRVWRGMIGDLKQREDELGGKTLLILGLGLEHLLITLHTAGETCRYEDNVLAIMQENLARLWRAETQLLNQVV
jgi:phosphoglycerate dehydrogenase-like enzyme